MIKVLYCCNTTGRLLLKVPSLEETFILVLCKYGAGFCTRDVSRFLKSFLRYQATSLVAYSYPRPLENFSPFKSLPLG